MPLDTNCGLLKNEGTCEMETMAQPDLSRLPTKMDSNAAKYCGKGYVIVFYIYQGY